MAGERNGAPGRGEIALLGLLLLAWLVVVVTQWHPFYVPNNDYASFERAARSLAVAELPKSYQRMPILPALMALLSPIVGGEHPYLRSALLWNAVFSGVTMIGLFALGRRTLGRGALLAPILFATTTQFHSMGLQPLVEPSLGCFVVLAFVGFERRSGWQYAAAFAAALSRYEAALLIPVLFAANVWTGARFWRQVALATAAGSGVVVWAVLGALHGSGGSTYLDLMRGMGFAPAPGFYERSLKEPFRGVYRPPWEWGFLGFAVAALVPLAYGVLQGWREFRATTAAMLLFFVVCVSVIVLFGINKARYVYPTEWIPLFFFAVGLVRGGQALGSRIERGGSRALLVVGIAGALFFALQVWRVGRKTVAVEPGLGDGLFLLLLATLSAIAWASGVGRRGAILATAGLAGALAIPVLAGGIHAKQVEMSKVRWASYGSYVAAGWLREHLAPGERAVVLGKGHILHLTDLDRSQLVTFAELRAEDLPGLAEEMDQRGLRYLVYTWRKPIQTPSDAYYRKRLKTYLAEALRLGKPVDGFEHVATLPLPAELERDPVQVYRRSPAAAMRATDP